MAVQLDHTMVSARDRRAAAELLAAILDVPWSETGVGPFCPVYVNEGLTLDFDQADGPFPIQHFCFRVSEPEFDHLVARLAARQDEAQAMAELQRGLHTLKGGARMASLFAMGDLSHDLETLLLRMADATLPGTDLLLSRTPDGWVLRADVRSRSSYDAIREAAPALARRPFPRGPR